MNHMFYDNNDLAKLYDYDLILLDLNLPDMNGHEVLRQLRNAKIKTPNTRWVRSTSMRSLSVIRLEDVSVTQPSSRLRIQV